MQDSNSLKKKIIYRAKYRGTKEMDILLSRFVDYHIKTLTLKDLETLYDFLEYEDEDIYNFYQGNDTKNLIQKNKFFKLLKEFKI
tara:strand:+ start:608 stop:862 length:255 start_codon:yes stop_codon:yes gene_type:complete